MFKKCHKYFIIFYCDSFSKINNFTKLLIKKQEGKMKKFVKLNLVVAVSLAAAQTLSADSIAQAFQDGKVSGELKSQYF